MILKHLRFMHLPIFFAPEGGGETPLAGGGGGNPPASGGGNDPWYSTVDQSHHDWLRNKQFGDLNAAIQSHRTLESVMGRNRLAVPQNPEDKAAYDAIYSALGRPNDAKGYKAPENIKLKDGVFDKFTPIFHELGLGQKAVEKLLTAYHGIATEGQKTPEQIQADEDRQEAELKTAWGQNYGANSDLASRAWRALGISEEQSNAIEGALGFKGFMEFFHKIGSGMGEHSFSRDTGGEGGGNSVERAKAERSKLFADPKFMERYQSSNALVRKGAMEEIAPWNKIIADDKDARMGAG